MGTIFNPAVREATKPVPDTHSAEIEYAHTHFPPIVKLLGELTADRSQQPLKFLHMNRAAFSEVAQVRQNGRRAFPRGAGSHFQGVHANSQICNGLTRGEDALSHVYT